MRGMPRPTVLFQILKLAQEQDIFSAPQQTEAAQPAPGMQIMQELMVSTAAMAGAS